MKTSATHNTRSEARSPRKMKGYDDVAVERSADDDPNSLITDQNAARLLGASVHTLNKLMNTEADFPRPTKLGRAFNAPRRWVLGEVIAYRDSLIRRRQELTAKHTERAQSLAVARIRAARQRKAEAVASDA